MIENLLKFLQENPTLFLVGIILVCVLAVVAIVFLVLFVRFLIRSIKAEKDLEVEKASRAANIASVEAKVSDLNMLNTKLKRDLSLKEAEYISVENSYNNMKEELARCREELETIKSTPNYILGNKQLLVANINEKSLDAMTMDVLLNISKELEITGTSQMTKPSLIAAILKTVKDKEK